MCCGGLCCGCRMKCDVKVLNYASLIFGLVSFGALSLAVATDFWLHISEPIVPDPSAISGPMPGPGEGGEGGMGMGMGMMMNDTDISMADMMDPSDFVVNLHSGLWRMCIVYNDIPGEEDIPTVCRNIAYTQTWERIEGGDTTNSILRAIRKASPSIVVSLLILVFALGFSTVGNSKNNNKTVIGAVLYTFSALSLAIGVIFYISAVNDEVSHRKPPTNPDEPAFAYHYGWAFFFAGSSFIFSLICAVSNISLYLRRYTNLEDMVIIIPGLEKRNKLAVSSSREMDESDYECGAGAQNPTIIL